MVDPNQTTAAADSQTNAGQSTIAPPSSLPEEVPEIEFEFDTSLMIVDTGAKATAASVYFLIRDQFASATALQTALSDAAGVLGYPLPVCLLHSAGLQLCRLDVVQGSTVMDALVQLDFVVAVASKATPVQEFRLGLGNVDGAMTVPAMQLMLSRFGADDTTERGCIDDHCQFRVERSQVLAAAPLAKPHPRTAFNVSVSSWKNRVQVEQELWGAGLLPMAVIELVEGLYTVHIADVLPSSELEEILQPTGQQLSGTPLQYFEQGFQVELAPTATLADLRTALFNVGIVPDAVKPQGSKLLVTTYSAVYGASLTKLATYMDRVLSVGPLVAMSAQGPDTVEWPYSYTVDFDMSQLSSTSTTGIRERRDAASTVGATETSAANEESPASGSSTSLNTSTSTSNATTSSTSSTIASTTITTTTEEQMTPQKYIQALVNPFNTNELDWALSCDTADGVSGQCQMDTTWKLPASDLAELQNAAVVQLVVLSRETTFSEAIKAGVEDWIGMITTETAWRLSFTWVLYCRGHCWRGGRTFYRCSYGGSTTTCSPVYILCASAAREQPN